MSETLRITVFEDRRRVHSEEYSEPVELGRQDRDDDEVYGATLKNGFVRIAIARKGETSVSKKQVFVEALSHGRVRLRNQSTTVSIHLLENQGDLMPTSSQDVLLPVTLRIGPIAVMIEAAAILEGLAEAPLPPGAGTPDHSILNTIAADRSPGGESLLPKLQAVMDVLHGAAVGPDCYDRAASALVDMTGLDAGRVLMLEGGDWVEKALNVAPHLTRREAVDPLWKPSTRVLTRLREEKKTLRQVPPGGGSICGVQALIAAPILDRQGSVIGALYGDRSGDGDAGPFAWRPITELQAKLVQLLASGVAAGLAQKKLVQMERDLEIGREIQAGFLPKDLPQTPGWEVAAHFRPARVVSGDFYDAFALPGGHLAVVIADVCDKGVGAALYMALIRSLLRAFAEQAVARDPLGLAGRHASTSGPLATEYQAGAAPLAELITRSAVELTNNYVAQTHGWQCMFCTLFFGVLDTASGALTYINAGHDAPALLGAEGVKVRLTPTGPVVGIIPNVSYKINEVLMEPGHILFAYTDGVTEAREPAGTFFTEKRLLSILQKPIPSATAAVDDVIASLLEHIAGAEPHDDVTILAVRRTP